MTHWDKSYAEAHSGDDEPEDKEETNLQFQELSRWRNETIFVFGRLTLHSLILEEEEVPEGRSYNCEGSVTFSSVLILEQSKGFDQKTSEVCLNSLWDSVTETENLPVHLVPGGR